MVASGEKHVTINTSNLLNENMDFETSALMESNVIGIHKLISFEISLFDVYNTHHSINM